MSKRTVHWRDTHRPTADNRAAGVSPAVDIVAGDAAEVAAVGVTGGSLERGWVDGIDGDGGGHAEEGKDEGGEDHLGVVGGVWFGGVVRRMNDV